jgi:hypothetical protein
MDYALNKYSYLLVFFLCFTGYRQVSASLPNDDVIKEITKTIQSMDAKKLADYFSSTIDLELGAINGNYSKTQAEIIMRDFFKDNPVKSFTVNHQGDSEDGSQFFIGTYTSGAKEYRVYGLLKKESNLLVLRQLQFDEE